MLITKETRKRLTLLVKLLGDAATLDIVADFLKSKGVPHSGIGWETLLEKRLIPALEDGKFREADLDALLAEAEEHGRQHVFLYQAVPDRMTQLMDHARAGKWGSKRGIKKLGSNELYELPDTPSIATVRFDQHRGKEYLVVKVVETRQHRELIEETPEGKFIHATFEVKSLRAVNVARLGSDGLLELRLHTKKNPSRYLAAVQAFWKNLDGIFAYDDFEEISLTNTKDRLWSKRSELTSEILYSDSVLRNENGTILTAATGSGAQSLFDDPAVTSSMEAFMKGDGSYCDRSNVWWVERASGTPSKNIHVYLAGEKNEFAITAHCSKKDYEFVLGRILTHGRSK